MRLRRMSFMVASLFALLLVTASARAAEEPTGFRDIPFGASEAQIREKYPTALCRAVAGDEQDDISCSVASTIGDVPVIVLFRLIGEPTQRHMMNVVLSFKSEDFDKISQAFTDRYGPPTEVIRQREHLRWLAAKTFMIVNKSTSTVGTGIALIGLREYLELVEKRAKERREKGK
jgi:hypothetical protein